MFSSLMLDTRSQTSHVSSERRPIRMVLHSMEKQRVLLMPTERSTYSAPALAFDGDGWLLISDLQAGACLLCPAVLLSVPQKCWISADRLGKLRRNLLVR